MNCLQSMLHKKLGEKHCMYAAPARIFGGATSGHKIANARKRRGKSKNSVAWCSRKKRNGSCEHFVQRRRLVALAFPPGECLSPRSPSSLLSFPAHSPHPQQLLLLRPFRCSQSFSFVDSPSPPTFSLTSSFFLLCSFFL